MIGFKKNLLNEGIRNKESLKEWRDEEEAFYDIDDDFMFGTKEKDIDDEVDFCPECGKKVNKKFNTCPCCDKLKELETEDRKFHKEHKKPEIDDEDDFWGTPNKDEFDDTLLDVVSPLEESQYDVGGKVPKDYGKKIQKQHQKTIRKGARGTFERISGDPEKDMKIFNHMMGTDNAQPSGDISVGGGEGGASMGEAIGDKEIHFERKISDRRRK